MPGVVAVIQTFGDRINFHPHIHVLITEGGTAPDGSFHRVPRFHDEVIQEIFTHEVFSLLLRKKLIGLPLVRKILHLRHRGKMRKAGTQPSYPPIIEDGQDYVPSKGWAEMIRKVYEVDPLRCPSCGGQMSIISFIEDHKVIDKIIAHLKLTFMAERPPPPQSVQHELLTEAEEMGKYF